MINLIQSHLRDAVRLRKPLLVGEFGALRPAGALRNRLFDMVGQKIEDGSNYRIQSAATVLLNFVRGLSAAAGPF